MNGIINNPLCKNGFEKPCFKQIRSIPMAKRNNFFFVNSVFTKFVWVFVDCGESNKKIYGEIMKSNQRMKPAKHGAQTGTNRHGDKFIGLIIQLVRIF